MTNTSPRGWRGEASGPAIPGPPAGPCAAQLLTLGMGPMGDAQGSRVGVCAVRDHPVEDVATRGQLVTGQEPHNARVTVVELGRARRGAAEPQQEPLRPPSPELGQHSQAAWR